MPRDGTANLIPVTMVSKEEAKKRSSNGGKKSVEARRNKKMLRDCLEILLEKKIDDPNGGKKITGAEALSVTLFQKALAGDDKAWELLRDTVGQKPIDKVEQTNTNVVIDLGNLDNLE